MPRPEERFVTFSIDGREVSAPAGVMLADGAKYGDIEIPVFCYEPKLGAPVGACRMCLVEVEGIPKLQTACSTPVKDGMVVHTQTQRVREAQNSVVEFLLVNHPLDCPVCDKGGECPLQDITFGWGRGISRMVEPKRHFRKPVELSPLIAIDRERCILCYRCVRFSQEVSEDYQLILNERGASSFVGTFDGHPYVAPFSGNIVELCPVGALTSRAYRFRARPWDIEGSGSVCTHCPAQCNVEFTVRDERVLRVLARDNHGVDDGWLCDKGRFAYQAIHSDERITEPLVRNPDSGELEPATWEYALDVAASAIEQAGSSVAAIAGGTTTNEEGFLLQRLVRAVGSADLDSRAGLPPVPAETQRALAAPALQATIPDIEFAHTVLLLGTDPIDDVASLDLRIRKGVRRNGVKLAVATSRPSALDANSRLWLRYAPGAEHAFVAALAAAVGGADGVEALCEKADADPKAVAALAQLLQDGGEDVVIVWGQRIGAAPLPSLLNLAAALRLGERAGAGLIEVPVGGNARGLREVGVQSNAGPGLKDAKAGKSAHEIAQQAADGKLTTLYLLHADPVRDYADRRLWERALQGAEAVVAHATLLSDALRATATVVFPAESYAEKEGTIVNLDGRVQRLRPAIGRPGSVRAEWQVLADVAKRAGHDPQVLTGPIVTQQVVAAVPFYGGLTLEEIGGKGVRWQERDAASAAPEAPAGPFEAGEPLAAPRPNGALRLGTYRSIWAAPEVEVSPALKFLTAKQQAEISPVDADRIGVDNGGRVTVSAGDVSVLASVFVRGNVPAGTVFLAEATAEQSATELLGGEPGLVEVRPA
ncbi:NADH-quinone oxidoreductase subunit NuoG [Conexibacter sp. JD483]|uniref:NADH-quinone oxidoreductase subunit NuoG n=1 Tax=unclassified Conexibacter TaxID=2627773 RepID=UPI0027167DDC|nr:MULTISPECIES: NADH-quinone oxidoreductase subunit NuoG [unclassified Conexibacter]MDO8187412.1 NADH-quinone oxidoreductase subunit NuoG [Conexibacter sp. CPCC 205706]MDO8201007.1 NADH-quinone oxidoreductase subunit NuoG [Conexibacter sp. CPCC 205762]MDR9370314.1 NADH-quinone oxidoreductase subunit NuoG [Conexibacter sp. JD483]